MDGHPHRGMKRFTRMFAVPFGGDFGCGDGKDVSAAAKAVREEEDVCVSSSRDRQGPKVVNTDGNARTIG